MLGGLVLMVLVGVLFKNVIASVLTQVATCAAISLGNYWW